MAIRDFLLKAARVRHLQVVRAKKFLIVHSAVCERCYVCVHVHTIGIRK